MNSDYIIGGILMIVLILLVYKYKKEVLLSIAYYVVVQAEQSYRSSEGQEKLKFAVDNIRKKLPFYLRFLVSEQAIRDVIETALESLQGVFRGAKEKQMFLLGKIGEYKGGTIPLDTMKSEIDKNGYIEGYLEGKIDLHGNSNVHGGVRFGKRF